jgi:hypothetical protein
MAPARAMLRWFECDHLPVHLQVVSAPFRQLAHELVERLPPDEPQTLKAIEKLLESKDCAVRATIAAQPARP